MNLSCEVYKIFVLFCLLQNFLSTLGLNLKNEQSLPNKVLTKFLKVPWINLNSSWEDAVVKACRDDITILFESADVGEMWALRMLDATSKVPAGLLEGNIRDLGMFDECLKVKGHNNPANIQGQHCMVSMAMPTRFFGDITEVLHVQRYSVYKRSSDVALSLTTAVCLPSSCDELDINGLVNASIASSPELRAFEVSVSKVKCSNSRDTELTLGSILVFSFFAVIAILLLSCTLCDLVLRARSSKGSIALKTASQFSLYTNILRLSSTKSKSDLMPALNGLRFFTLCLIVCGHRVVSTYIGTSVNVSRFREMKETLLSSLLLVLPSAVDTFLVLSGFLVTLSFLEMFQSGKKINIFSIYLHRYLRLTPCIAVLLLFTIFVIPHLGSGPNWDSIYEVSVTFCKKNWWVNLLHVQNIVNIDEMCLMHTWYVAVEMQLFCLCPIVLYPLYYRPKLGLFILGLLSIAAFAVPGIQIALNQSFFFWDVRKSAGIAYSEFLRSYPMTYNRALPYLLGILLGYDVFHNKRQISRFQAALNWSLTGLFLLFCVWTSRCTQPNGIVYNVIWETISVTVARLGWSLAMAWTIYACTQGYGGLLTRIMSSPVYVPLARLTYSTYLVHFMLQVTITATERSAVYVGSVKTFSLFLGELVLSIGLASVLYLCIECPVYTLEKILRSGRSPVVIADGPKAKPSTLSTAVKNYLDSINGRKPNSDLVIDTITSKLDFWQAVSNELNRVSRGPIRTPIDWSKKWQNWKHELLNMDTTSEAESTGVRSEGFQFEAMTSAFEKELITFLAAMNCSQTDMTIISDKKSRIMRTKSQSYFCNQQHRDPVRVSIPDPYITIADDVKRQVSGLVSADDEYTSSKL